MAYEKHTWQTGETITAEKLNNLEDGVDSNNSSIVNIKLIKAVDGGDISVSWANDETKRYSDIAEAINNGKQVCLMVTQGNNIDYYTFSGIYYDYDGVNAWFNFTNYSGMIQTIGIANDNSCSYVKKVIQ